MTRPPPPPPSHMKPSSVVPPSRFTTIKRPTGYDLPMASEYVPAWVQVLRDCGYPTTVVVLDFETYFDETYGLRILSIPEYIADPRFEIIGVAGLRIEGHAPFVDPDSVVQFRVGEEATRRFLDTLQYNYGKHLERCTIVAQNCPFDLSILAMKYSLHPRFVIDTAFLARCNHTRSKHGLKDLCKKWRLPEKGETKEFLGCTMRKGRYIVSTNGKRRKAPIPRPLMTDNQVEAMVVYANNDAAREWELFTILLPRLSNPATELKISDLTLRMVTQPVLEIDKALGLDLIQRMGGRTVGMLANLGVTEEAISGNISFDALLTAALEEAGDQPMKYHKVMKKGMAYGLAKEDPELKALKAHPSDRVRALVEARSEVKSIPLHIARIDRIIRMADAWGGLMPIPLTAHGAHTGRDSGGWNVNIQNLPKAGEGSEIKRMFMPPPGQELVVVDLAGIEARVVAYLAGQKDLLESFRNGADVYSKFASVFFNTTVRKAKPTDPPPVATLMTNRRQFGKICCLGLGYQMGAARFSEFAKVDQETAERAVKVYRDAHPYLVTFWGRMQKAFGYVAKYKRSCELERGIRFSSNDEVDVVMTLPNGRELNYHRVKIEMDTYGRDQFSVYNEITRSHEHLFGGMLTENVVQAVSRDVFMEAMLRLDVLGYRTLMRIHDELVISVPKGQGKDVLAIAIRELCREPTWAPGLPLGAEGKVLERFGNH